MPFALAWEDRDTVEVTAYYRLANGALGRTLADGTTQRGQRKVCENGTPEGEIGPIVWVNVTSLADLVAGSLVSVSRQVPLPTPGVNPPPESGGYVNLGMWLAVGNPAPVSVTASSGGVWARTTATISSTVFEMGNGDIVECDGFGSPLEKGDPGWDSSDQGPCGYTYTQKPPAEPYAITVTTTWAVTWETSAGTSGVADPIVRTASFDYKVREIQTVGIAPSD